MKAFINKLRDKYILNKKKIIISNILLAVFFTFLGIMIYSNLMSLYSGGNRLITTYKASSMWNSSQMDDYITNLEKTKTDEYVEYEEGYEIIKDIKDGKSNTDKLSTYLEEKNNKYSKIMKIGLVFQYLYILIVLPLVILVINKVIRVVRRLKNGQIS